MLLTVLSGEARAECTLDAEAIRSYLDTWSPAIEPVVSSRREGERSLTESVTLKNGTNVTFSVGGCDHLGLAFTFRTARSFDENTPLSGLLRIAREELDSVPIREEEEAIITIFREAFASGGQTNGPQPIPGSRVLACGDATCELTVPEPGVLAVTYSFAL